MWVSTNMSIPSKLPPHLSQLKQKSIDPSQSAKPITNISHVLSSAIHPLTKPLALLPTAASINQVTNQMIMQEIDEIMKFLKLPNIHKTSALSVYFYLIALKKKKRPKKVQDAIDEAIEFFDSTRIRGTSKA